MIFITLFSFLSLTFAIQTSDSPLTKNDPVTTFNACNYQTKNNTLYHLKDINPVDGGSDSQQLVVQNDTHRAVVFNYCKEPIKQ